MIFISICSMFIALFSLFISAFNFIRTWKKQRFNISYQIINCYFVPNAGYYAHFQIINNSSEAISITGIVINEILSITDEQLILSNSKGLNLTTQSIPLRIESYGAKQFYCYFEKSKKIFAEGLDLEIRTSRGVISSHIKNSNGFLLPITELIEKHKNNFNI